MTTGLLTGSVLTVGLVSGPAPLPAEQTTETEPTAMTAGPPGPEAEVIDLTNAERARAGCPAVTPDPRIAEAAQRHSDDMAAHGYFDHDSRNGQSFDKRIAAEGYPAPGAENIARGQPDAQTVVRDWMNSPGHRRNILDCSLQKIGVGLSGSGDYWTQDFGY